MIVFCLMLILLLTEQWIKRRILRETSLPRYLGRGYLLLRQYNNYGLPFSRLRQHPGAVKIIVTLIMIGALAYTMPWIVRGGISPLAQVALGLIFGGGLSNLLDRYSRGYVIDYFSFPRVPWAWFRRLVFNLADICIFLGILLLLIYIILNQI